MYRDRIMAPGPTPVPETARRELATSNPYHRTDEFGQILEQVREDLGEVMGLGGPVVLVNGSGTAGMELAASSACDPGDRVLVVESGKFGRRWSGILTELGVDVDRLQCEPGSLVRPEQVRKHLEEEHYQALFTTLVETSTLVRHPVERYLEPDDSCVHVVDAISGLGAEQIGSEGIDLIVGGSQKGFMAPPGLSFVGFTGAAADQAKNRSSGGFYLDPAAHLERQATDGQTPWTPSMDLVRALAASLDELLDEGLSAVQHRHERIAQAASRAVEALGLELFGEANSVVGTPIQVPEPLDGEALQQHIYDRYNLYVPGGQQELVGRVLRLGHLGYVDFPDLLGGIGLLEQALDDVGWEFDQGAGVRAVQRSW